MFRRGKLPFLSTKDDRIKLMNDRINLTEKHLNELRGSFADCARRLAKQRDGYDELARTFKLYAEDEEYNESLSGGLEKLTNATTILADHMDMKARRLEAKIINELAASDVHCKTTRDSLRVAVNARDKEVLKQRQMLELRSKFAANNPAADSELVKAKQEVNRTNKAIDEIINNFEKRKLEELKSLLCDFLMISLKFHTKSLETLTASYYDISHIDERYDLLEFQKLMKTKKVNLKKRSPRSQSMEDLDRNELLSPLKRRSRLTLSTKNLTLGKADKESDDDSDDKDEDDDDDDVEEEEDDEDETAETSSQPDEEDSGSLTEVEAHGTGIAAGKRQKLVKPLLQSKDPFKAAAAATHMLDEPSERRPFAVKGSKSSGGSGRLVTVVRSKKRTPLTTATGTATATATTATPTTMAEVIDCTRTKTTTKATAGGGGGFARR